MRVTLCVPISFNHKVQCIKQQLVRFLSSFSPTIDAVSSYRTELIVNESDFVCTDERRLNCPSFNLKFKCEKQ